MRRLTYFAVCVCPLTRPSIAVYNCGPRSNSRRAESNSDRRSREQAGNGWPESVVCRIRFRRYPLGIPLKTDIVLRECTGGHRVNARLGSLNCAINSGRRKLAPDAKSCLRAADFEIHRHVADTRNPEYLKSHVWEESSRIDGHALFVCGIFS